MKKTSILKQVFAIFTLALSMAVLVPAAGSETVSAAPKKVTAQYTWQKAKTVKTGTTKVILKKGSLEDGFVKFKAPKTGTYVVTVSNLVVKDSVKTRFGGFMIHRKNGSRINPQPMQVKTEGGKSIGMNICTKQSANSDYMKKSNKSKPKVKRYLTKRTATFRLKKNTTIWIDFTTTARNGGSCTLKIKKK